MVIFPYEGGFLYYDLVAIMLHISPTFRPY